MSSNSSGSLLAPNERAFIWDKPGGFRDLNTRIASGSGWTLESATSINDHNEIVGRGDYEGQDDTGFLQSQSVDCTAASPWCISSLESSPTPLRKYDFTHPLTSVMACAAACPLLHHVNEKAS
jgi:hypothetical protein